MAVQEKVSKIWRNMFAKPVVYKDIEEYEYVNYYDDALGSENVASDRSDYTLYNRDVDSYLAWFNGMICMNARIVKSDGNAIDAGTNVAVVNLGQFAYWRSAELLLNDVLVEQVRDPYYVALVKYLTRLTQDSEGQSEMSFFYKDGPGTEYQHFKPYNLRSTYGTILTGQNVLIRVGTNDGGGGETGVQAGNEDVDLKEAFDMFENGEFNKGHGKRYDVCMSTGLVGKNHDFWIPLSYMFDFFDAHRFPMRGVKVSIRLYTNLTNPLKYLLTSDDQTSYKLKLNKLKLFVPRIKPTPERERDLLSNFNADVPTSLMWYEYSYHQSEVLSRATTSYDFRVASTIKTPYRIYIFFQHEGRTQSALSNTGVFDHLHLTRLYVKVNQAYNFPKDFLVTKFDDTEMTDDYMRAYLFLLESQNKLLNDEDGMIISYRDFKEIYPLFVFNLSHAEERVFKTVGATELNVVMEKENDYDDQLQNHATNNQNKFRIHCIIESVRSAALKIVDQKMIFTV